MSEVFIKILTKLANEQLAPLLFGALLTIVILVFYLKIPERLSIINRRVRRIEQRQHIMGLLIHELLDSAGRSLSPEVRNLENLFNAGDKEAEEAEDEL